MTEHYQRIINEVGEVRRQWRARLLVGGALLALAAGLAALLVTVAADNLFHLGTGGRLLLAVLLWATLVGSLIVWVARPGARSYRDDFFAAIIEQRHPELHNLLLNALQLGRGGSPGSPRLIAAVVEDAAAATGNLQITDCLDRRPLRRAGLIALGAGVLLVAYALIFPGRFGNGLARVLLPAADIPPYTATQIIESSVKPGNTRVPEGATVTFEARLAGALPDEVQLVRRPEGRPWQTAPMQPLSSGPLAFQVALPQLTESFAYYVRAGDGSSRQFHLEVVQRPRVQSVKLAYLPPPYALPTPREADSPDGQIAAVAGVTVTIEIKSSKPLREASLVTSAEPAATGPDQAADPAAAIIGLTPAGDPQTWRGSFVVWSPDAHPTPELAGQRVLAPTRYYVRLLDTDGYENTEPLWRPITLLKDQPPRIAITSPGKDLQLNPDAETTLALETTDDFGIDDLRVFARVNEEPEPRELARFAHPGPPQLQTRDSHRWNLAATGLKAGDLVQYWATVTDRNTITGPGRGESRRFSLFVLAPTQAGLKMDFALGDYAQVVEELLRLQRENRAQTASRVAFPTLVSRQTQIRTMTDRLARAMEKGGLPVATMVGTLDELHAGLMAEAIRLLERGRDNDRSNPDQADQFRNQSLPVQDQIIAELQALLARLQKNQQARDALRRLGKTDKPSQQAITDVLAKMIVDLSRLLSEEQQLDQALEKLPKHVTDEFRDETKDKLGDLEALEKKIKDWAAGKVDELTKLPAGFVDDFGLRPDVKKMFEEIEKAAERRKTEKLEVAMEDSGDPLQKNQMTRMKEDLEVWLPDTPDYQKWLLEDPLQAGQIPEMPLPDALEDMIGDLLQKAEEFDETADDVTSAWGLNLDQAGWLAVDGPQSVFSAKGKTGNDLPNSNELTGRSGDGRRGKSSGQMVGDTARGLKGRPTPARLSGERYEPGNLKQEGWQDPGGATGGGKKAGAGTRGLQGGTPPDFVKDMQRLSEKQAAVREKAEQVAQKLDAVGVTSRRLGQSINLMKSVEQDYRDLRYEDAARRRRVAIGQLNQALTDDLDQATGVALSRAKQLPAAMREEILQATDQAYPPGYEDLLKNYFRALSETR